MGEGFAFNIISFSILPAFAPLNLQDCITEKAK
jgi:hypothetical protein